MSATERAPASELERVLLHLAAEPYELTLFVSGASTLSARAVTHARSFCDAHLPGRYVLTVVDVRSEPGRAGDADIVAVPTLACERPLPRRLVVGDLSDTGRLLRAFGLITVAAPRRENP